MGPEAPQMERSPESPLADAPAPISSIEPPACPPFARARPSAARMSSSRTKWSEGRDTQLGQWAELCLYTKDGAIPIDNNATERALRTVAVGRNNWTFCGSEAGGKWAAMLYGLLGSCRLQGKNPFAWLKDVLERVRDHPADRMEELTPRLWTPAQA